jgi:hypothetical protein
MPGGLARRAVLPRMPLVCCGALLDREVWEFSG